MTGKTTGVGTPHPAESKEICSKCVEEEFLRETIRESGVDGQCSYCGDPGRTLAIGEICIFVRAALQERFSRTDHLKVWGNGRGCGIVGVIAAEARIKPNVAEDIRCVLEIWHQTTGTDGGVWEKNPFDPSACYESSAQVDDGDFHVNWHVTFERSLKTKARYFNRDAEEILHSLFDDIEELRSAGGDSVIVAAGPGTAILALYRARVFQSCASWEMH